MKKLSFAHATSPHAERYNFGKACWMVEDDSSVQSSREVFVYEDTEWGRQRALKHFERITSPLNPWSHTRASLERGFKYGAINNAA